MADRVLTWYIPGVLSNNVAGTNVSTEFVVDRNYKPVRVILRQKTPQAGDPTIIDINDDGVSIFPSASLQPALGQGLNAMTWEVFAAAPYIEADSVITLDVDQVSSTTPGANLTVTLELETLDI